MNKNYNGTVITTKNGAKSTGANDEMDHHNLMKSAKYLRNNIPRDESTVTAISLG